jgi:hypothetical protein
MKSNNNFCTMPGIKISSPGQLLSLVLLSAIMLFWVPLHSQATPSDQDALLGFLQGQPIGFSELEQGKSLRSGNSLLTKSKLNELRLNLPAGTADGGKGQLFAGTDSMAFTTATMTGDNNYFVFDSLGGFDQWIAARFPNLVVPVAEDGGLKLYSYQNVKKIGEKRFKLELVLRQLGIPVQENGNMVYANLDNFRDALGSCIVQWAILNKETSVLGTENGQFRAIPQADILALGAGEGMVAGKFTQGKFVPPVAPRTNYLWLFLGMVAGGGIMGLVVMVIGKGKKGNNKEVTDDEGEKLKHGLDKQASKTELTGEDESESNRIKDKIRNAFDGQEGENLEKLRNKPSEKEVMSGFAALVEALANADSYRSGADSKEAGTAEEVDLRTLQAVMNTVAAEMKAQGSEEGHDYMLEFRNRLSDWLPAIEGLRLMAEESDPRRALELTRDIRKAMEADEEMTVLPLDQSQAVRDLKTVLDRYANLQQKLQAPDPAHQYLTALDQRYGGLTALLSSKKELSEADRAELMSRIVKMVLHLNDFLRIYLEQQHSEITKINPRLLESGGNVQGLPSSEYTTFTESKTEMPLAVRNWRILAREAGIKSMDDVLVEGYHIPADALQK